MTDIATLITEAEALLLLLESGSKNDSEVTEKADKLITTCVRDLSLRQLGPYESIIKLAIKINSVFLGMFRSDLMTSFQNRTLPLLQCGKLFDIFILHDIDQAGYLHSDWMENDEIFTYALDAYINEHKKRGCGSEELQRKLQRDLAVLLTYRRFTPVQVKALVEKLPPDFNPRTPITGLDDSLIDTAKRFSNSEVVAYLESLSPAPPLPQQEIPVDPIEFQGIIDLLRTDPPPSIGKLNKGTFLKLNTLSEICSFCGVNPSHELSAEFFISEMRTRRDLYSAKSPEDILEDIRKTYQSYLNAYRTMKSLLLAGGLHVYCADDMLIDTSISREGAFEHTNVGTLFFQERSVVCKYEHTIHDTCQYKSPLQRLKYLADFIGKVQNLKRKVPRVVEILPCIFLNKVAGEGIKIGYFMELVHGTTLRDIQELSIEEKENIQAQFDESVELMLTAGYALYDFHQGNVLWDGQQLTFIDLAFAGFRPEALKYADTEDVKYRMSQYIERKPTKVEQYGCSM